MTLQEVEKLPYGIFLIEPKISVSVVTKYGLEIASSNCALNEFVRVKYPILNR